MFLRRIIFLRVISHLVLLSSLIAPSAASLTLSCPEGWSLIGSTCNKVYSRRLTWDGAYNACKLQGSDLVQVKDAHINNDIGLLAKSNLLSNYWIGLRSKTKSNLTDAAEWSDGTTWSLYQGFWSSDQPDSSDGSCVSASDNAGHYRWSLVGCENKNPFICQYKACDSESFRCSNDICLSSKYRCDGKEDCQDGLDEINCSSFCKYMYQNESGSFSSISYPKPYSPNSFCQWTIETSVGSVVEMVFTDIDTELGIDEIVIFGGGKSEVSSMSLKHLSGQMTNYTLRSFNNFLIVRFTSDSSKQGKGFNALWSRVFAQEEDIGETLIGEKFIQFLSSPQYPSPYLPNQESVYIISSRQQRQILHLKILDLELAEGDYISVYDGIDASSPVLAQMTSLTSSGRDILSSGPHVYLLFRTQQLINQAKRGFNLSYETGCSVVLDSDFGKISSPGFPYSAYSNSLTCTWKIKTKSNKSFTLLWDNTFDIHPSDELLLFPGLDLDVSTLENTNNSITVTTPTNFSEPSGKLVIIFRTSAILNARGFKATFSADCVRPTFNNNTLIQPSANSYPYGSVLNVTCRTGHVFDSEEFYEVTKSSKEIKSQVLMVCNYGGQWNVQRIPNCTPRYCGLPPPISNGFILSSSGVVYGSEVNYGCYSQYKLSSEASVKCLMNGTWSAPPSCVAFQSCPSLNTTAITNLIQDNGTELGSVYGFQCLNGYELIGFPNVACRDGNWSSQIPSCKSLVCVIPYIPYATVKTNALSVAFGVTVIVECITGYVIKGTSGNVTNIKCQSSMTFGTSPVCEVSTFNYCSLSPCSINETCVGKIGGYECQCQSGFFKQGSSCQDIDECQQSISNCSQLCTNTVGGYNCKCQPGYELYMYNGSNGYFIPTGETGLRAGDVYHINHTCVLHVCEAVSLSNGYILNPQATYHVNDTVAFSCNIGFVLATDTNKVTCTGSGSWTPSAPYCKVAQCAPDTLPPLAYPPAQVIPSVPVDYLTNVTIVCIRSGKVQDNRTRTCLYDPSTLSYKLQGDSYDCGAWPSDCGTPEAYLSVGALALLITSTRNGTYFRMECELPYLLSNQEIFVNVYCVNGLWDFNNIYCIYGFCPDPVAPQYGTVNVSSYNYGDVTTFGCSDGYHPSSNVSICDFNEYGGILEWNVVDPICIDDQNSCHTGLPSTFCRAVESGCNSTECQFKNYCSLQTGNCLCEGDSYSYCPVITNNCKPDSCSSHGTCIDNGTQSHCVCTKGFTGQRCETPEVSACDRLRCDNKGTRLCQPLDLIYAVCLCKPGYSGHFCTELNDACATEPCRNGGTCEKVNNSYTCSCVTGFKGTNCELPELTCGSCRNASSCDIDYNTGLPLCTCSPGYTQGPICDFQYLVDQTLAGTLLSSSTVNYKECHISCLQNELCDGFTYTFNTSLCSTFANVSSSASVASTTNKTVAVLKKCHDTTETTFYTPWITPRGFENGFNEGLVNLSSAFEESICTWTQPLRSECRSKSGGQLSSNVLCDTNRVVCPGNIGLNCTDVEMRFLCARSRVSADKPCLLRDVCQELKPCVRGICEVTNTTSFHYKCICPDGYEGANCQHEIKTCPGTNSTSTTCFCPVGFTGDLCDINVDDCVTAACSTAGTLKCIDGNNTYTCVCKTNYTGAMCQLYEDDCLSQPCLHGGTCIDLNSNFTCSCPPGWTGRQCETLINLCDINPCKGGAKCTALLDDFYCSCPSQTYSKVCDTTPDVCNVSNPCLNGAQCLNNGLNCSCLTGTTFAGCQLYSSCEQGFCQNGGSCLANINTPALCTCLPGYSGIYCETPIHKCPLVNCISPATCVEGINEPFCRCPIGKQGATCMEDIKDDFDYCIRPSSDTSGATLPYPVPYNDTGGFTVKLWVKFTRPGSMGNFLTLYYTKEGYKTQPSDVIFAIDHVGVRLRNLTYISFLGFAVNDGNWHNVLVSWKKDTGQVELVIDYLKNAVVTGYLQGITFSAGGFMAVVGSSQSEPQKFVGCISDLDMLDRPVDTSTELNGIKTNSSAYLGNVFRWGELQPIGNVLIIQPSSAALSNCTGGGLGPSCSQASDITPPVISQCPSNLAISTLQANTPVSWSLPPNYNFTCTHQPGDIFALGSHTVVCVTKDLAGNTAICSFSVYVNDAFCPSLPQPRGNGTDVCNAANNFTYCSMDCPAKVSTLTQPAPYYYTCGPEGAWESLVATDGLFPSCGLVSNESQVNIEMSLTYNLNGTNCTSISDALKNKTREKLLQLQKPLGNVLCSMESCQDVAVVINCSQPEIVSVQISLQNISTPVYNGSEVLRPEDLLLIAVLDDDLFNWKDVFPSLDFDTDDFNLDVTFQCPLGQVFRNGFCVSCGPGTYYNTSSTTCENCPVGLYAETYGQLSCSLCPSGKTTRGKGSDSAMYCTTNCSSGEEFLMSTKSCVPCHRGYFRDSSNSSQENCLMCPADFITPSEASVSSAQCYIRNCTILGTYRNAQSNQCENCPIGTYSDTKWQEACRSCPSGQTTESVGTSSVNLCYTSCSAGQYFNISQRVCLPCDSGQYQDMQGQFKCLTCPFGQQSVESKTSCSVVASTPTTSSSSEINVIVGCVVGIVSFLLLLIPLAIILWRRLRPTTAKPSPTESVDSISHGGTSMSTNYSRLITRANLKPTPDDFNSNFDPAFYHSKPAAEAGLESQSTQSYLTWRNSYSSHKL
ncbi:fibropellin-1 [Biomphalaria glabrata]|uniref:Uncharacterized protein LOC106061064 n=1 Tax=Biomphalaria glabrata TaxID=6526 RepID=A0A9W2ZJH4_BIOGL|nr:uncharacterized protein LOC106061064 [Biomphalaria glabrata]KAI8766634.1 hypothetical protein; partial [Biomphalaria glabrata]